MDRSVPIVFALLGVLGSVVDQLRNALPELLSYPSTRSLQFAFLAAGTVVFVVTTLAAVLGYLANRRVNLPDEYARFGLAAGVAGGFGFLTGTGAVLVTTSLVQVTGASFYVTLSVAYNAITKAISIGLFGLAGAAVGHFRETAGREKRRQSADA